MFIPAGVSFPGSMIERAIVQLALDVVLVFALAYAAARLSSAWGGRGDLDAGFVFVSLATTPMFLAGAVGPLPGLDSVYGATAFMGQGFKFCAAIGAELARRVLGTAPPRIPERYGFTSSTASFI